MPYCRQCGVPLSKKQKICVQCGTTVIDNFQPKRHWEMHPGSNSFFCDGRFVTSTELWLCGLTWLINIAIPTLYFVFDADYIWHHISPAIVIIAACLIVMTLSLLFRVGTTDPGIIPRGEQDEIKEPNGIVNQFKLITVRGQEYRLKYCYTCKLYRPPRSSHCRQCDNCVEGFDHHCPWVGNCIGARNYRYFFVYVLLQSISCMFYLGSSLAHLILEIIDTTPREGFANNIGTVVVCAFTCFFVVQLLILLAMHMKLVMQNVTTNEEIRQGIDRNVYDEGCCGNVMQILCGPRLPSRLLAREPLVNGRPRNRPLIGAEPPVPMHSPLQDIRNLLDPDSVKVTTGAAPSSNSMEGNGNGSHGRAYEMRPLPPLPATSADQLAPLPPLPNMENMPLSVSPKLSRTDRMQPYLQEHDHVLPDYNETSFANASHTALPLGSAAIARAAANNASAEPGFAGALMPDSSRAKFSSPQSGSREAVDFSFTIDTDTLRKNDEDTIVTADGIITCV